MACHGIRAGLQVRINRSSSRTTPPAVGFLRPATNPVESTLETIKKCGGAGRPGLQQQAQRKPPGGAPREGAPGFALACISAARSGGARWRRGVGLARAGSRPHAHSQPELSRVTRLSFTCSYFKSPMGAAGCRTKFRNPCEGGGACFWTPTPFWRAPWPPRQAGRRAREGGRHWQAAGFVRFMPPPQKPRRRL